MLEECKDGPGSDRRRDRHLGIGQVLAGSAAILGCLLVFSSPARASEESNTPAPNLASQSCTKADRALAERKSQPAIRLYTQCLETANLTPKQRATVLTNRGNVYFREGEQELATADFDKAIDLNPDLTIAYYNRGLAAFVIGRYEDAIADSSAAIRLDPTMAAAFYNRGAAYANMRDYPKAIADLTEAIRLRPDWALAYSARGDAYLRSGDAEKGSRDHAEAARLEPKLGVKPAQP